jgi:hypothetical protein
MFKHPEENFEVLKPGNRNCLVLGRCVKRDTSAFGLKHLEGPQDVPAPSHFNGSVEK